MAWARGEADIHRLIEERAIERVPQNHEHAHALWESAESALRVQAGAPSFGMGGFATAQRQRIPESSHPADVRGACDRGGSKPPRDAPRCQALARLGHPRPRLRAELTTASTSTGASMGRTSTPSVEGRRVARQFGEGVGRSRFGKNGWLGAHSRAVSKNIKS